MQTCADMLKKLEGVYIRFSMSVAMEDTEGAATDQQRLQLAQGLTSTGEYLPDYSFRSVFQYGKEPGPIKLYDTGAFYRGMKMDVTEDLYILESKDSKSTMLQNKYGKDILGLGTDALNDYITVLRPAFIKRIKEYFE